MANVKFITWIASMLIVICVVESAFIYNPHLNESKHDGRTTLDEYYQHRKYFINNEVKSTFGSEIVLNENETLANEIIMRSKEEELNVGYVDPHRFIPSRHIFEVLDVIKQSKLFQIIRKMPKGGILHLHESAMCSTDFIVSLTYWPDLWQKTSENSENIEYFRFARVSPTNNSNERDTMWRRVKDVRSKMGALKYDASLRKIFTLFDKNVNPRIQFKDTTEVWKRFLGIFDRVGSMIAYAPAREAYFKNALSEMLDDGVQYLEFRSSLSSVCVRFNQNSN